LAASANPATLPVTSVNRLASALAQEGDPETAVALLRVAQRIHPDDFWLTMDLARFVRAARPEDASEALRFLTAAASIRPQSTAVRTDLGEALADCGRRDEALAVLRETVRAQPDDVRARVLLSELLVDIGRAGEAIAILSEVPRTDSCRAGRAARELGPWRGRLDVVVDRLMGRCERLMELEARLPALLRGEARPASDGELAGLAELCYGKQLFATSARLWTQAFAARPTLAEYPKTGRHYHAARAAARAGCGQGNDDPSPDAAARAVFRAQSRDWLATDLAPWSEQRDPTADAAPREIRLQLARWRTDPDLACVRDPEALAKLSDSERAGWDSLWATAGALLAKAEPMAIP
jgi:tetratricopeptide (TPR) repeat protein